MSDNRLKLRSVLESRCHSRSLFGPLQARGGIESKEFVGLLYVGSPEPGCAGMLPPEGRDARDSRGIPGKGTTAIAAKGAIQDRTTIIPMSATTDIRAATTPTRTRPAIIAVTTTATATIGPTGGGATTMAIIGVGTTARDTITVEGSKRPPFVGRRVFPPFPQASQDERRIVHHAD